MQGADQSVSFDTFLDVAMRPAGSGVVLDTAVTAYPVTSTFRSFVRADKDYAPVHLTTDGKRWLEHDGPTFIFDWGGTQGGLDWFFPILPGGNPVGMTWRWTIPAPAPAAIAKVEAARGKHRGLPKTRQEPVEPYEPYVVELRFEGWKQERGARIAELSMSGTYDVHRQALPISVHASQTFHGSYAITASGRLLRAEVVRDTTIEMAVVISGKKHVQHHEQHAVRRIHLVGACNGPTETSLRKPLTRPERAIEAWGRACVALRRKDEKSVLGAFDPALRRKQGDAKLWAAIREIVSLRGDNALPLPVLLQDKDLESTGAGEVRFRTHGLTPDPTEPNTDDPVDVEITMHEVGGKFVASRVHGTLALDHRELFDLALDHLTVRRGWPSR